MNWPQAHEFQDAVLNPQLSFADDDLRGAEVVKDANGLPVPASGQFGIVYQMAHPDGRRWAIKCFTAGVPGREDRYKKISAHLQNANLPFMVRFSYLQQGVYIQGEWFPILKMDWVEGPTLNRFVGDRIDQPQLLRLLTEMWVKVGQRLRDALVTHADLQHGNVMLVPGKAEGRVSLRLVDYDGMYLPSLAGTQSGEVGHPGYQHPKRLAQGLYGPDVDRFSHLVIYTALRALHAKGRRLWQAYDHGDNLLFRKTDFTAPRDSKVLQQLWREGPEEVRFLAGRLVLATEQALDAVPQLEEILDGTAVRALTPDQVLRVDRILNVEPRPERPAVFPLHPGPDDKAKGRVPVAWAINPSKAQDAFVPFDKGVSDALTSFYLENELAWWYTYRRRW